MTAKAFVPILLIGVFSACASVPRRYANSPGDVPLDGAGLGVTVVEKLPAGSWKEIDTLECAIGFNGRSPEANVDACKNKLRNDAASLDGTLVLLRPEQQRIGQDRGLSTVTDESFPCANCVNLRGPALRRAED